MVSVLGNILPLLSLEGLAEETGAVRGPGVYANVLRAMGHLREAGVLFGVSVTATPRNAHTLASEEFFATLVDREVVPASSGCSTWRLSAGRSNRPRWTERTAIGSSSP
jgi:hypothetical protein